MVSITRYRLFSFRRMLEDTMESTYEVGADYICRADDQNRILFRVRFHFSCILDFTWQTYNDNRNVDYYLRECK